MGALLTTTRMAALSMQQSCIHLWRRFYFLVDLPSMFLAILTAALLLVLKNVSMAQPWLHMKLTCAFLLIGCDLTVGTLLMKAKLLQKAFVFRVLHITILLLLAGALFSVYVLKGM
jgi:uncharacterized membrane protein